jgi:hypothetical protein
MHNGSASFAFQKLSLQDLLAANQESSPSAGALVFRRKHPGSIGQYQSLALWKNFSRCF